MNGAFKVRFYDEVDEKIKIETGIIIGEDYNGMAKNLLDYYGESIDRMEIEMFENYNLDVIVKKTVSEYDWNKLEIFEWEDWGCDE